MCCTPFQSFNQSTALTWRIAYYRVIASILSIMIRKTLKILWIIQEQEHKERGYFKRRMNPFNPLTYISILIIVLVGFLMFGFVGFWKEVDLRNPFRWS